MPPGERNHSFISWRMNENKDLQYAVPLSLYKAVCKYSVSRIFSSVIKFLYHGPHGETIQVQHCCPSFDSIAL